MLSRLALAVVACLAALPAHARDDVDPKPLPGWVQAITRAIDWISSLAPSGVPSDFVSSALFMLLGAATAAAVSILRRALTRRFERIAADATLRKLEAKKLNEHIKVASTLCNTVGAAVIGAAFIVPYIGNHTLPGPDQVWWIAAGSGLLIVPHVLIRWMQSEG